MLAVSGCGAEPQHKVSYVSGEKLTVLEQYDCVAVYTQYTNDSSETAVPADEVSVKAFQNGVELSPLVPTGDRTNGYVQCDSNVQSGTTADVVWLFELDDDSTVSVELSGGEKVEIPLWVLAILIFPFAVLYEIVKMNEQSHHRGKRKRRKRF